MTSFDRKMKRATAKKMTKIIKKSMGDILEDALKSKLESYSRIPDNCTACKKSFDKKNREQVFSWMMQIHEEKNIYNLFCPECYEKKVEAGEIITNE